MMIRQTFGHLPSAVLSNVRNLVGLFVQYLVFDTYVKQPTISCFCHVKNTVLSDAELKMHIHAFISSQID